MTSISLGSVIWTCVKPIIKIYLIMGTGFFLAKRNILTVETTRNLSDIILTVFLPCLTFNKVVNNIADSDIKNIGIICLTSIIIFALGGLFAVLIKFTTPAPKRWTGGLISAGIFPNISDIPIAYIQTLDTGTVFTTAEGEKGISHVIIFLTMFTLVLFNLGGFRLVEKDFIDEKKNSDLELQNRASSTLGNDSTQEDKLDDDDIPLDDGQRNGDHENEDTRSSLDSDTASNASSALAQEPVLLTQDALTPHNPRRRRLTSDSSNIARIPTLTSTFSRRSDSSVTSSIMRANNRVNELRRLPSQNVDDVIQEYSEALGDEDLNQNQNERVLTKIMTTDVGVKGEDIKNSGSKSSFIKKYKLGFLVFFLQNCLRPCSLSTIVALVITFIPWTRALFVETDTYMPDAPDGQPPLNFIMDYTSYIGAASVPLALILLGGAIARIQITTLPKGFWKTALALLILRLVLLPIIGALWGKALVAMGWVAKDDTMMRFVCIISFGLPTMTSIIYFTASYTPNGSDRLQMNCSSLILLVQYPILVISLPFLATYTIKVELGL